jgi:hypothetical protein
MAVKPVLAVDCERSCHDKIPVTQGAVKICASTTSVIKGDLQNRHGKTFVESNTFVSQKESSGIRIAICLRKFGLLKLIEGDLAKVPLRSRQFRRDLLEGKQNGRRSFTIREICTGGWNMGRPDGELL